MIRIFNPESLGGNFMTVTCFDSTISTYPVLGVPVAVVTMQQAIHVVNSWIDQTEQVRLVTFTNVHMVVEAALHSAFQDLLMRTDLNCPDGAPVYWLGRTKYGARISKIAGPEFMPLFCEQSVSRGYSHFLYGGDPGVAEATSKVLSNKYPGIDIVGHYSPPFRALSNQEQHAIATLINASGAHVVWVCLGCPKQEQWMSDIKPLLTRKVVLAVGQAFSIVAGASPRAPSLLVDLGLEWLYRLTCEPRRLWKRYLTTNALFIYFLIRDKLRH